MKLAGGKWKSNESNVVIDPTVDHHYLYNDLREKENGEDSGNLVFRPCHFFEVHSGEGWRHIAKEDVEGEIEASEEGATEAVVR